MAVVAVAAEEPVLRAQMRLLKARQRREVADLDYRRTLKAVRGQLTQQQIAWTVGISQSAVSQALKSAASVENVREGFSGASVTEVCQRFAADEIGRVQLVEELVAWPYVKGGSFDEFGDYTGPESGTVQDLVLARGLGLIDDDVYDEVVRKLAAQANPHE